jgi:hypothetical protein
LWQKMTSPDQTKKEYINRMGEEVGPLFYHSRAHFLELKEKWFDYEALFGTSLKRVDIINRAAPAFFGRLQTILWREILLSLCRLTDPAASFKRENLSIRRLATSADLARPCADLASLLTKAESSTEFAKHWRNKVIAHSDLEISTTKAARQLPDANRGLVRAAIADIEAVLIRVFMNFNPDIEIAFPLFEDAIDAEELLYVLRDGIEAADNLREKCIRGVATADELRHRPI